VTGRYQNAYAVQDMARATDKALLVTLRSNFLARCRHPLFSNDTICSEDKLDVYSEKLEANYGGLLDLQPQVVPLQCLLHGAH